jgi:hypothetical protein
METLRCDMASLGKIMADHTQVTKHRHALPLLAVLTPSAQFLLGSCLDP